jgi:hypothetical protein
MVRPGDCLGILVVGSGALGSIPAHKPGDRWDSKGEMSFWGCNRPPHLVSCDSYRISFDLLVM